MGLFLVPTSVGFASDHLKHAMDDCIAVNWHLRLSVKRIDAQRGTKVSPWYMHCTYCSKTPEATSSSEKIKPVFLAIIELRLPEGRL